MTRERLAGGSQALNRIREAVDLACEGADIEFVVKPGANTALYWFSRGTGRMVISGDHDALTEALPNIRAIYENMLAARLLWPLTLETANV